MKENREARLGQDLLSLESAVSLMHPLPLGRPSWSLALVPSTPWNWVPVPCVLCGNPSRTRPERGPLLPGSISSLSLGVCPTWGPRDTAG